jgi:hypothetical protein
VNNLGFDDVTKTRWRESLEALLAEPIEPTLILTLRPKIWPSASRPFIARGADKCEYVVKARQADRNIERQMVNDQVVARLGVMMNAPVAKPSLVEISTDLIELSPLHSYIFAGTAHATEFIKDCSDDRELFLHTKEPANRDRFALLCVLYGWVYARDHQFIYRKLKPNLVHSVDHGHFFIGGPDWNIERLTRTTDVQLDRLLLETCKLTCQELESAVNACLAVTAAQILEAVAAPPTDWGLTIDDRLALVEYLMSRQKQIMAVFTNLC